MNTGSGEKQDFTDAFKVEGPKFNDIWAAVLYILVFCGFTAVSGIAIQGYASIPHSGIYGSTDNFGLTSNTVILL